MRVFFCRWYFGLALLLTIFHSLSVLAADEFPYAVRTKGAKVALRCGPGREYYACAYAARGDTLEVFDQQGDWLAVRPTETCHSFVLASQIERTDDEGLGEVTRDQAVCWIGADRDLQRDYQWQVRLDQGETVEILGETTLSPVSGAAAKRYLKIAPPAGEFRWVKSSEVQPELRTAKIISDDSEKDDGDSFDADLAVYQVRTVDDEESAVSQAANFVTPKAGKKSADAKSEPSTSKWRSSRGAPRSLDDANLEALTLELSLEVANEPGQWNLEPLHAATERLVKQSASSLERAKAKRLLERIKEFETIHKRHVLLDQLTSSEAVTPNSKDADSKDAKVARQAKQRRDSTGETAADDDSRSKTARKNERRDELEESSAEDDLFAGKGFLAAVHSTQRTAPPYALVDKEGNVLQFVSPSPGLNLHRYLRKQVGILGESEYEPTLRTSHLTAERIVELDRHRR